MKEKNMNSDELFEIAYCKGRREAMKSMVMWLKEHSGVARNAIDSGMDDKKVLATLLDSMEQAASLMEDELSKKVVLLSLQERPTVQLEELKKEFVEKK